jgi:hypothetical protein
MIRVARLCVAALAITILFLPAMPLVAALVRS